jgi:hypothetical protein
MLVSVFTLHYCNWFIYLINFKIVMDTIMTTEEQRTARSYKLILLFAMVSMTMMFAGLTSAFVVSKSRQTG